MMTPEHILGLEVKLFLGALFAMLAYRMLAGQISMKGLFADGATGQQVSPERVQLLMTTLMVAMQMVRQVAQGGTSMPEVSTQTLVVLGASSGLYTAVKGLKMWRLGKS